MFFPVIPGSSSSRDLTFKVRTTDKPGTQLEPMDAALHGVVIPYAGRRMFTQTLSVTFMETADWSTTEKFRRWIELARSWRNNSGSLFNAYSTTALLVTYNDIPQVSSVTQINHIWPENMNETSLDGGSSNIVDLTVSFKYVDWVPGS